jgi:hypothetical protein
MFGQPPFGRLPVPGWVAGRFSDPGEASRLRLNAFQQTGHRQTGFIEPSAAGSPRLSRHDEPMSV